MTVNTLASSSSGNCTVVSHGDTHVLIDAGISLRRIKDGLRRLGLLPGDVACVLITHGHTDHISGLRVLSKYIKTTVFASCGAGYELCGALPEAEPLVSCFETGLEFEFGDFYIHSFRTPHDSAGSVGYTLRAGGKKLVYATDLGCVTSEVTEAALGADIAIIEANHDRERLMNGPYPGYLKKRISSQYGHLENFDSGCLAALLALSGTRQIQLSHLSRENNTPELARAAVCDILANNGLQEGKDVEIDVAPPFTSGKVYEL